MGGGEVGARTVQTCGMSPPAGGVRAVTAGYLREPETELPLTGDDFAQRVQELLATPTTRPEAQEPTPQPVTRDPAETVTRTVGRTAKR